MFKKKKKKKGAPMFKEAYMAHALGGYRGYRELTCEAALRHSYICGFRYFEVDFKATVDDHLVCCYGWGKKSCLMTGMKWQPEFENMTHELFMKQTVHGFPVMDAERLFELMQEYKDIYVEVDLKTLDYDKARYYAKLIKKVFKKDKDVMGRLLIQVNSEEMFKGIDSVHHFDYYQFNLKNDVETLDNVLDFCKNNGICAIALKGHHATDENVAKIKELGMSILLYTVDGKGRAGRYLRKGVDTICTNFLRPGGIPWQGDDSINIIYDSAIPVKEEITPLLERHILRGELEKNDEGAVTYMELLDVLEWCEYDLMDCLYKAEGKRFTGWKARSKTDTEKEWMYFATDGEWHSMKDIKKDDNLKLRMFGNREHLRIDKMFRKERIVFEAVWEDEA